MVFTEFAQKLSAVIRSGTNTVEFTRTLFESILDEEGQRILEDYQDTSYKAFYNGNSGIHKISQRINGHIEPMNFEEYINSFPDGVTSNLCNAFKDDLPDIDQFNAGEKLSRLFVDIITQAAKGKEGNNSTTIGAFIVPTVFGDHELNPAFQPSMSLNPYIMPEIDPFQEYIDKAKDFYSQKKTLLYAESPKPFYSMYVCNDLRCHRYLGSKGGLLSATNTNADVPSLEKLARYNIIEGTGGIGKSMFMTHLFLSSAENYQTNRKLPILILLKDYKDNYPDLITFAHKAITDYAPDISRTELVDKIKKDHLILLLDGLDEIKSQYKESFDSNLESFIKCYPDNTVFLSSRPITDFIAYSQFTVYDIEPLRQEQAVELIEKLEFWDKEAQQNFITDLNSHLYASHKQFASNPLLLTIMLMTYTIHGDIPAKMHSFYAKAYETMARLHDATKGSYKRPLCTGLDPEVFKDYFSQFCARTFIKEQLEFTKDSFSEHMKKVIKDITGREDTLSSSAFLQDLTDNLCIMYCEGEKYYFIHRSFQEYFAALYFVNDEEQLTKIGEYIENNKTLFISRVLDMMYDMAADKVERFIFFPYLNRLFIESQAAAKNSYLGFLSLQYPTIYYNEGEVGDPEITVPWSVIYESIVDQNKISRYQLLDDYPWPSAINDYIDTEWVNAYTDYLDDDSYKAEDAIRDIEMYGASQSLVSIDQLTWKYKETFDYATAIAGCTYSFDVVDILNDANNNIDIIQAFLDESFPLHIEYMHVREYYSKLKARIEKKRNTKALFDD